MTDRDRSKTLNGKHSSLCHSCQRIVYHLWVDDKAPPLGCAEGHDDEIWKCGTVYNALVSIVIGRNHFGRAPDERQKALLLQLGSHGPRIMADIRSGKMPPSHPPKEPSYARVN